MSRVEHSIGLTPVLKRLAWHYAKLGVGSHAIDHPAYDEVVVEELYDWHAADDPALPPQGGLVVAFMMMGKRVRWVEFGCRVIGGGGGPIFREV